MGQLRQTWWDAVEEKFERIGTNEKRKQPANPLLP